MGAARGGYTRGMSISPILGAICCACGLSVGGGPVVWLDELDLSGVQQDWGRARARASVDGHGLSIGGKSFERGVGTHASSEFTVDLAEGAERFRAMVGVDDEPCSGAGSVVFVVEGDGRELARTGVIRLKDPAIEIDVDVRGVKALTLIVEDGGDGINYDHADWAEASVTMAQGAKARVAVVPAIQTEMPIAAVEKPGAPRLNYPRITGGSPGKPLLFRVPASGGAAMTFSAEGLPPGLELDAQGGIIRGVLAGEGTWTVRVSAQNAQGKASQEYVIVGGKDALALTPPMGWNSWNCWAGAVDDAKVRAAAQRLIDTGLAAHGYQYVNIDDTWEAGRDASGMVQSNEKFPDMAALSEAVHAVGLKLGIYSSPGPKTCAGFEGSYRHELDDAKQYAAWGVDYLKYDWCSYGEIAKSPDREALIKPYRIMRDALRSQPRDIVFSLCQYGMGNVWEWGAEVDGNCWRTTGDITDTWGSMSGIGFSQTVQHPFARPGRWNDPDMLVVGKVGWSSNLHDSHLTHNEQITHMTLWSMLAAPLLIGCDLSQMDDFTMRILTNDRVLSVNQDALGKQARRVVQRGRTEIWTKPMSGGGTAVAFFNRGRGDAEIGGSAEELGLAGPMMVWDAWMDREVGPLGPRLGAKVPSHAASLYLVMPKPRAK